MFKLLKKEGGARRGELVTVHGTVQTPVFMNVATDGAIKGGLSACDLENAGAQIMLCNTYHLHVRPGDDIVRTMGGIRRFTTWKGPVLTDSGGFQVFSLAKLRNITERGVIFNSHVDGSKIFMGPEESMRIQSNLGSTIAMAFDECIKNPAEYEYAQASVARTERWLVRCANEMHRLNAAVGTLNRAQMLFGINQGATFADIRVQNMKNIAKLGLDGYAIGGLSVGESTSDMYRIIEAVEPYMPDDRPRYLMGVGTPSNIIEAVARGIDMFDCVMPTRNARHAHVFTWNGRMNLMNAKYKTDDAPLDEHCGCAVCRRYTRAYVHHLFKASEILAMRLAVFHNLYFYNSLLAKIREAIDSGRFQEFRDENSQRLERRI